MNGNQKPTVTPAPAQDQDMDLSNLIEFPATSNYEFGASMSTHMQNLFLSYGKERVLKYLMETQNLQRIEVRGRMGKVA